MKYLAVRGFVLALVLVAVGVMAARVSACPGCKEAVAAADDENGTPAKDYSREGAAISYSVLFMLAVPAMLLAGFGTAFYRLSRKAQHLQQSSSGRINSP